MHLAVHSLLPGKRDPLRSTTLIRRRQTQRRRNSWTAAALMSALVLGCATIVLVVLAGALRPLPLLGRFLPLPNSVSAEEGPVEEGPAPLTVRSEPPGAQVVLDGRARGRTPLQMHTSIGRHAVLLNEEHSISTAEPVDVAVTGTVLEVALWTRHPAVQHLRSPYPGAQLADAAFVSGGGVQLVVARADGQAGPSARSVRESWLIEPASGAEHGATARPAGSRTAAVAVSPDGRRVATLQDRSRLRPAGTSAQSGPSRLDTVWVGDVADRANPGTPVFQLDPPVTTMLGLAAQEELAAIAWLPDSRHLLIASRFGDPAAGGPVRTRVLLVDAGAQGDEAIDAQPAELIVVPAEVLLGSAVWSADGQHLAVLVRAAPAPGGKRLDGIGVIDVRGPTGEAFQYVADLGPEDGAAGRLAVAPVAWEPCSAYAVCGVEQRLLYMAPVPNAGGTSTGPLAVFGLGRPQSATPGGLFASTVSLSALLTGDAPRLGTATGMVGLAWRSAVSGVEGASLIGMARDANKPLALRAIDSVSGHVQDLGVQLAPEIGAGASSISVRWDVPHSRALVVARQSDRASVAEAIDAWLVDFAPAAGQAR